MRYALVAILGVVLMPALAQAGGNFGFFFGFNGCGYGGFGGYGGYGGYPRYYGGFNYSCYQAPAFYCPPVYYPSYSSYQPYYSGGGGYYGRYSGGGYSDGGYGARYAAKTRVNTTDGYASAPGKYARDYSYRRSYDNGRALASRNDANDRQSYRSSRRSSYYGPALERYSRDAQTHPSYHYDRRETSARPNSASRAQR